MQRANTWRNRLDTTTNWAVLTAGATLSFAFSSPTNPHFVILINSLLVAFFLFMEARRYRYYEIWSSRVRVLETSYFSRILAPEATADDAWAKQLSEDLVRPHFTISEWEAVGRRLRRNYLWIFALLAAVNLKSTAPAAAYDSTPSSTARASGRARRDRLLLASSSTRRWSSPSPPSDSRRRPARCCRSTTSRRCGA